MLIRTIAHLDMDAFFAAVEVRDNPQLADKPVVIGADPKGGTGRGVVSTCSYEARLFGIHSAMPISRAYQLCPQAVFLRGSHKKYKDVSRQIFSILHDFTPDVQPISIDEAFLDLTGCTHFYGSAKATCQKIKERIKHDIGLNASIGIAPNKMVAKIASDYCKPDGLIEISEEKMLSFLWSLPIDKIWGVGKKMQAALHAMGIRSVKQLADTPADVLIKRFGSHGEHLHRLSHGIDNRPVEVDDEIKSVSHEHTFDVDTSDREQMYSTIAHLSEKVSRRLRKYHLKGRTLTVKIRTEHFRTFSRAHTWPERTNFFDVINQESCALFDVFYKPGMKIRLIGVRLSQFEDPYVQESLFEDEGKKRKERVHQVVDQIKDKYGDESIFRASG